MATDPRYEAWFRAEGVRWDYNPKVSLDRIDRKASLEAQARLDKKLDEDMVVKYAYAMETGAVFPPLVGYDAGGRIILIGGNHRTEAADLSGRKEFDLYLIRTDDRYVIDRMTRSMNFALEGKAGTQEEALQQAIFLATTYGKSAAEVARSFNLRGKTVENAVRLQKHLRRIESIGISTKHLSPGVAGELGKIPNDRALQAVENLRTSTRMPSEKLRELVKAVAQEHSEDKQLEVVRQWSGRPDVQSMREHSRSGSVARPTTVARMKLYRLVSDLENMLKQHTTPASLQLTRAQDVETLIPRWREVDKGMESLLAAAKKSVIVNPSSVVASAAKRR